MIELTLHQGKIQIRGGLYFPEQKPRGLVPAVIFCHGIPGGMPDPNDKGYIPLIEEITSCGLCAVLFNFRGCGLSGGNIDMEGWGSDLEAVLDKVYNTPGIDPSSIHCIGSSAGGAIASKVAAYNKHIKSLMLMATPADLSDILPEDPYMLKSHFLDIGVIRDQGFPEDIDLWYNNFVQLMPARDVPFISPRPVAIVHGTHDTLVPERHAKRLYDAALDPKDIILVERAPHQLRKDTRTPKIITDWLNKVA